MPKSSSERSSKSEFSDSEFVFGGVKFNGGIDLGDGGGERDGDLGEDSNRGGGEGSDGGGEGDLGEMGIWLVETVMWRVVERGMWGVGIFAYFAKHGELWEKVERELVLQGSPEVVERGIWGGGDLCLFRQARRVVGESAGGIGITGEPTCCSVFVFFS